MAKKSSMTLEKIDRFLGGVKFAVIIICFLALTLAVGTFLESYNGTEFAQRLLYKSWPFFLLLGAFYVCVFMAALLRLPPQKRLYGFYTVHAGLILMLTSSFVTYYAGVDGTITLAPHEPTRVLSLSEDELAISFPQDDKLVTLPLPYSALARDLDLVYENIHIKTYLPFSDNQLDWAASTTPIPSTQYRLQNSFVGQELVMSLHPQASEFPPEQTLGPLNVHYVGQSVGQCVSKLGPSQLILWNTTSGECFTPEERKLSLKSTSQKNRFLIFPTDQGFWTFFPDFSAYPLNLDFQLDKNSPWRILNLALYTEKPHLLLLGTKAMYAQNKKWQLHDLDPKAPLSLPWMGFELSLLRHEEAQYPQHLPVFTWPVHQGGKILKGEQKAILVEIKNGEKVTPVWAKSSGSTQVNIGGKTIELELRKKTVTLPYELTLTHFKMDKDPGSNSPASYESFVNLFESEGASQHHIYMNNPLKKGRFTFYQASYFETEQGYGSVLSVNYDPGRMGKYAAALLIVLGSIWHFYLRRKTPKTAPAGT